MPETLTTPGAAISASIRRHAAKSGIALVPFVTGGFPDKASWPGILERIDPHAAAIEVGIPFSDPMADGVTIQYSSRRALEIGVTPRWVLEELARVRPRLTAPIAIMSYLNPLMALGGDLPPLCRAAGVDAVIIPDLPYDESEPWRTMLARAGVGVVQMVTPSTPEARLRRIGAISDGFLYAVTRAGVTGGQATAPRSDLTGYLERCRGAASVPVCAGFGIRTATDVKQLTGLCDGAIVGSALVDVISKGEDPVRFLAGLRA